MTPAARRGGQLEPPPAPGLSRSAARSPGRAEREGRIAARQGVKA